LGFGTTPHTRGPKSTDVGVDVVAPKGANEPYESPPSALARRGRSLWRLELLAAPALARRPPRPTATFQHYDRRPRATPVALAPARRRPQHSCAPRSNKSTASAGRMVKPVERPEPARHRWNTQPARGSCCRNGTEAPRRAQPVGLSTSVRPRPHVDRHHNQPDLPAPSVQARPDSGTVIALLAIVPDGDRSHVGSDASPSARLGVSPLGAAGTIPRENAWYQPSARPSCEQLVARASRDDTNATPTWASGPGTNPGAGGRDRLDVRRALELQTVNSNKLLLPPRQRIDGTSLEVRYLSATSVRRWSRAGLPHRHHPLSGFLTLSASCSRRASWLCFTPQPPLGFAASRAFPASASRWASRPPMLSGR
jgi:hypothetical protein